MEILREFFLAMRATFWPLWLCQRGRHAWETITIPSNDMIERAKRLGLTFTLEQREYRWCGGCGVTDPPITTGAAR